MQYFRNFELVKLYPVSEAGVRKWIIAARRGRLDLQLHEQDGKFYIANTAKNQVRIEELVKERKKYLTTRTHKVVTPSPEFYSIYSQQQVVDLVSNLDIHREIPRQYNYFGGGAEYWDRYAQRLYNETAPNLVNSTVRLLNATISYLDELIGKYKHVNIIDVGVGNALPTKSLLAHLLDRGVLNRYIAVDISSSMLNIAEQNIREWFGSRVPFEGYIRDITHDWFADLLAKGHRGDDAADTVNLVLLLGGTPQNFRSPIDAFKVIYNSMGRRDLLVYTTKLDSEVTRRSFDFNVEAEIQPLPPQYKFIVDLLNIDPSYYEVELGFDEHRSERYLRLRLKVALTIRFQFEDGDQVINLNKDERIMIWRGNHQTTLQAIQELNGAGFGLLNASHTDDYTYLLMIAGIQAKTTDY